MANYVLAYTGGGMAQTEAEREAAMAAWGAWFGTLGPAIVDAGNPCRPLQVGGGGRSRQRWGAVEPERVHGPERR